MGFLQKSSDRRRTEVEKGVVEADVPDDVKGDANLGELWRRKQRVQAQVESFKADSIVLFLTSGSGLVGFAAWMAYDHRHPNITVVCLLLGFLLLFFGFAARAQRSDANEELSRLEDQLDLYRSPAEREKRALWLLTLNQNQLFRYYKQNLSQSSKVFVVGVYCIALGIAIIGGTLYALSKIGAAAWQEKLIVGVVGAIGAILTNYVAAIYLKMQAAISSSLSEFHSKLVESDRLYLAHLLVSSDADGQKERCEAFVKLSEVLLGHPESKVSEPVTSSTSAAASKDG